MNSLQIIGFIMITIGTIVSFIGSCDQSKKDNVFQNNLTEYVEKQTQSEIPILKALRIEGTKAESSKIIIKNIGKTTASKVKLIYNENSTPSAFSANLISGIEEIAQGVEVDLPLNLFSGISLLEKLPNDDKEYKENLLSEIQKFRNGEKAFIPKFHLEYYFNNEKKKSEDYFLVIENKRGIIGFGKSEE